MPNLAETSARDGSSLFASHADLVARARALAPTLKARATAAEEQRRLPPETERDFHATGLYRMLQPRSRGGAELDFGALVEIGAAIACGCASSAWNLTNLASHHWMLAMFPEAAQSRIWNENPDALIASSFVFPAGKARLAGDGYRLSGRWPFSSGVDASDWTMLGGMAGAQDGSPGEPRIFLLHRSRYAIIDTWRASGLKGTGSNDVACEDVFVPAEMTLAAADLKGHGAPGSALHPNPLYRLPVFALFPLILSGVALGNAEACLNDHVEASRTRASHYSGLRLAELQSTQIKIGAAGARVDIARRTMLGLCAEAMADARRGHVPDIATKMRYRRDTAFATALCTEAVDLVHAASGAQALYMHNPLQRQFRDAHAIAQHIAFNMDVATAAYGRVALGLAPDNPMV